MTVLQIVTSVSEESSGVTQTVEAICRALSASGTDVELHSLQPLDRRLSVKNVAYRRACFPHPHLGRSPEMLKGLKVACKTADIAHVNGLWQFPDVYPLWASRGTKCKLVVQPHGTLSKAAMKYSRLIKFVFGHLFQYEVLRKADMFVATSQEEYEDIRRLGYRQPVVVLPNGVDLPSMNLSVEAKSDRRRMFFLSRIHPKKNVEMLIRCWAKLESRFPNWDLSIVGPDKNNPYADQMKELAAKLSCQRVKFEGELNGDAKYRFMAESDCEVLPTHSENFGMVVAEALACGTPVICSHGAPWEGLMTNKCGWWVPTEEVSLESAMCEAMSLNDATRQEMGARGREWMKRDFDWNIIGQKMKIAYAWLLDMSDKSYKPEWILVN